MVNLPQKWTSAKTKAVELLVDEPGKTHEAIGKEVGVSRITIHRWSKDPEFVEVLYRKYMISFGGRLPSVLSAMVREAEAGNVQAGRLVLEHSGKLIKRVEIANTKSPFEAFLKSNKNELPLDVEFEDATPDAFEVFPRKPVVEHTFEQTYEKVKKKQSTQQIARTATKRTQARKLRDRARKIGLPLLARGRQSPLKRIQWKEKLEELENQQ
jgi:hypothetical protein